jgi:hypothetical protein
MQVINLMEISVCLSMELQLPKHHHQPRMAPLPRVQRLPLVVPQQD